jgi:hypothetical protein
MYLVNQDAPGEGVATVTFTWNDIPAVNKEDRFILALVEVDGKHTGELVS